MPHTDLHFPPPHPDEPVDPELEQRLQRAFAPLDARALGLAFGLVAAFALVVLTGLSLVLDPDEQFPLGLLGQYFPGYSRSLIGIPIGAAWFFATGFAGGWLLAKVRNLAMAAWLLKARVRADLDASQDVLDHI